MWARANNAILNWAFSVGFLAVFQTIAAGALITTGDIAAVPQHVTGSGNGTIDLRLFTHSGTNAEIENEDGAFNGDNGNATLPQGGGADTASFAESYLTTAADLKAFYNLNFPANSVGELLLFLDLNETGGGIPNNTLVKVDIVLNPTTVQGNPSPAGDVTSPQQAAINQAYTGGTLIAQLFPEPADNIPVNSQGAGWADYAIFTGINPFALNNSDVLLINFSMATLNNGAEEIFLSGTYSPQDVITALPEPSSAATLALAGLALLRRRR